MELAIQVRETLIGVGDKNHRALTVCLSTCLD
jgi:hypothetical protein